MFVSAAKYRKVVSQLATCERQFDALFKIAMEMAMLGTDLQNEVQTLKNPFTDDELKVLLQLVHPDKHGGKESAVRMTQKINQLRGK